MAVDLKTIHRVEISYKTVIFTVFFLLGLWFLYEVRQIIIILFISTILMSALNPTVDRLEKLKITRWMAILLIYFFIFGLLILAVAIIIPPLIEQTASFVSRSGTIIRGLDLASLGIDPNIITTQLAQLSSIPVNILKFTISLFSNIVELFALIIMSFYLLIERKNLNKYLLILFGEGEEQKAEALINKVEKVLGGWVRGELTLMVIIGTMTYLGLRLLGIDYALPLAIMAGILEVVPNIGPTVSAIPAILVGLISSPVMALAVTALYFLIQQMENSLIVPKVMQQVAGVNPLVTILSLAIGFQLGGISGAILAVPIVLVIKVVISEFVSSKILKNL